MEYENVLKEFKKNKNKFIESIFDQSKKKLNNINLKERTPDLDYLELSDLFLKQYRRTGTVEYLEISNILRKVAHKLHWVMIKKGLINKKKNFINLV